MESNKVFGWMNKVWQIDLSTRVQKEVFVSDEILKKYIGGRGLGVKLYSDMNAEIIEPFSPENPLIFFTGPLTGIIPTAGRYQVISRSPLTGTICDSSSGGFFGNQLKKSGIDGFIITGKAEKPVYLQITDDNIEIKDASDLWGKNTQQTRAELEEKYPGSSVASIGPAGENLVLYAAIMNDKDRAAGRGGMGAVMGSKNLKAIVVKGTKKIPVADPQGLKKLQTKLSRLIDKNSVAGKALNLLGTAVLVNVINDHGLFPTKNYQKGIFNDADGISGEKITERILQKRSSCFRCPIACGRTTKTPNKEGEGPEYESVWALGALLGINDLIKITEANYLCNELGLDTISTGNTIACAMELSEKGAFPHKLEWGDADILKKLIQDISNKKGVGAELAEGSKRLAEKYGKPELAMQVKGMEMPAYDPRGAQGQALAYATSNRGGCHIKAFLIGPEIMGSPMIIDRYSTEGKADIVAFIQDISTVVDSFVICRFVQFAMGITTFKEMMNLVTGLDYTDEELMEVGKRIFTLERIFNNKAGFSKADDNLPPRFFMEKLTEGSSRNRLVELDKMLNEYYQVRGWDENGVPTQKTITELGL